MTLICKDPNSRTYERPVVKQSVDVTVSLSAAEIGTLIANLCDDEQAEVLRVFVEQLSSEQPSTACFQAHYIAKRIAKGKEYSALRTWLENLLGSIELEGKSC